MKIKNLPFYLFLLFTQIVLGQTALIKGVVKDQNNKPIENVSVKYENVGTATDQFGAYSLEVKIPKSKKITLVYSHVSYKAYKKRLNVRKNGTSTFSPKLSLKTEQVTEVIIDIKQQQKENERAKGIETIDIKEVKKIPTINDGISDVIKSVGSGVTDSGGGESSTYNVRGGNYDENLVYVNGIEVYRPFLVRSGQQEGLSFVNANLTKSVSFSSGGFQAKYGDKLSSVLDITYRKPHKFGLQVDLSLLGASLTVEGRSKNKKLTAILGSRYRNNSLIVNSKDIESNYKPSFTDVQTYITYKINSKFNVDFLGNFALNKYDFTPFSRVTKFGVLTDAKALVVNYEGKEIDKYATLFGALKATYNVNERLSFSATSSSYNAQEEEYYDIDAYYSIGNVNADFGSENFGNVEFPQSIGSQLNHARNDLDALINNIAVKGKYKTPKDAIMDSFEFGVKYQREDIRDRIISWEVIDSAGFSVRPPYLIGNTNDQPFTPYTGPIVPYTDIRATNNVAINRLSGFLQWSREKTFKNDTKIWMNLGIRSQNWTIKEPSSDVITSKATFSPRAQFSIKPAWKKDMLFRISGGLYHQPPFYKELRDANGAIQSHIDAQQAIHLVLANDYNFTMWERPFKLVTETYYKKLTNVNPFTIDNVQIRYAANNDATAYAAGFDTRLSGEFVPGIESYFTFGLLQTKENINDRGYIYRPTDQRLKFAVLFQDYMPRNNNLRMYLNMVYNTGVPGGSPAYADPYAYQNRLKDYFRSDIGIHYLLVDSKKEPKKEWLNKFKELSLGIELYNMFDVKNSITNTWVRDVSSKQSYAIPNFLAGRILNAKISMKF
ncbi:MAG: carboxypeptidase-like regulatory domain-containing protein [Flavobacteriaceae bacterium]